MNKEQLKQIIKEELTKHLVDEATPEEMESSESDYRDEKSMLDRFSPEELEKMRAYKPPSEAEKESWESDYRDERPSPFSPEDIEKMRAYKSPTQAQKDAWESDYFKENKMNKTKIKQLVKEELAALAEGGNLQNTAKGAAMALLHMAKVMEQSPSHEPASLYAQEVAKQANLIMDMLVQMEDDEAGRNPGGSIGE